MLPAPRILLLQRNEKYKWIILAGKVIQAIVERSVYAKSLENLSNVVHSLESGYLVFAR